MKAQHIGGTIMTLALAAGATQAMGQNLLENPGFEDGLNGWGVFGNVFHEVINPPQFEPHSGDGMVSMFGLFSGQFNVSGMYQSFPADPGSRWEMDAYSRHFSGDAMVGDGAPDANWVVMKIVFRNAVGDEIGSNEATIMDGTFLPDVWHNNDAIEAEAPADTVAVEPFILYLQPLFDGGAAHIDDVYFAALEDDCPADFNGDGVVNSQDFVAFLNAFTASDPSADFNGDGVVNSQDFVSFLNAFVAGC
jgi:hypothetical protein